MDFIDDVNLVAPGDGGVPHCVGHFPDAFNAVVRRSIDLDDVDEPTLRDCDAGFTSPAWFDRGPTLPVYADAVQCFCDQSRGGCLANAAYTSQQKGVRHPVAFYRIAERLHHRVLPDKFGECLGTIFAREDSIRLVSNH